MGFQAFEVCHGMNRVGVEVGTNMNHSTPYIRHVKQALLA